MGFSVPAGRPRPAIRVAGASLLAALLVAPGLATPSASAQSRAVQTPKETNTIKFEDGSNALPYPSRLTVEGVPGTTEDVDLILYDIEHTNPDDIDIMLVGPNGEAVIVLSDAGGSANVDELRITIDDEAATQAPDETPLQSRSYKVSNFEDPNDPFGSPAPAPNGLTMERFDNIDPNGQWRLYVKDDSSNDLSGFITGGWALRIQTTNTDPNAVDDRYRTRENESLRVPRAKGVLANDRDVDDDGDGQDDDRLTVKSFTQPREGKVRVKDNGSFVYRPKRNSTGSDSFQYVVTDGKGGEDTGRVTIDIIR